MNWTRSDGTRAWHRWFAWYPGSVMALPNGEVFAWLEWVERQTQNHQGYICHRYRPISVVGERTDD